MASELTDYLTGILNGSIVHEDHRQVKDSTNGEDPAEVFGRLLVHQLGWAAAEGTDQFESGGAVPQPSPAYDRTQGFGSDMNPAQRNELMSRIDPEGYAAIELNRKINEVLDR
ncbi:hypothetical protein GCM10009836_52140 [Pseudonocardia ailaonensis]|uniref:Uncharacterized protein n=2 Tax=Pseudonocardia ailaonensis TaxID=367279 RepID=A0ABN2NE58_9PSEU